MAATPRTRRLPLDLAQRGPGGTGLRVVRAAVAILLLLAGAVGVMMPAQAPPSRSWILSALLSRQFMVCAIVLLVCAALVVVLGWVLWQAGAAERRRRAGTDGQSGAAIVEFALVLPFILLLVLLMIQSALLMVGNMCVHYGAFCAARSAIVAVPLNLGANEPSNVVGDAATSLKRARIKSAAVWAVMPVSCGSDLYPAGDAAALQRGLQDFFGQSTQNWLDGLPRRLKYAWDNTDVNLASPVREPKYRPYARDDTDPKPSAEDFVAEDLHVSVTHTFYLSVPYIGRMFRALAGDDGRDLDFAPGQYGIVIHASCQLPNEGTQDWVDVETFP